MAYSAVWDETAPADSDNAGQGDDQIRAEKRDTRERLDGFTTNTGLIDLSGTRTINTDPHAQRVGGADTAALAAGAIGGLTRAATYFGLTTVARGGGDSLHSGATAVLQNQWESVTGMTITIPGTVLATAGLIERTNGAAITTSDYVIFLVAVFLANITTTAASDSTVYRLRNTTNTTTVSAGDSAATGAAATHGIWTQKAAVITAATNNFQNMIVIGRDTGRTAATTYNLEYASVSASGGVPAGITKANVAFTLADGQIFALVFKR